MIEQTKIKKLLNFVKGPGKYVLAGLIGGFIASDYLKRSDITTYARDVNVDGIEDFIEISANPLIFQRYSRVLIAQKNGENFKFVPYEKIAEDKRNALESEILKGQKRIDRNVANIANGGYAQ